jgi:TonB family protein
MRTSILLLLSAPLFFAQSSSVAGKEVPTVMTFVAPAYPRAAKDARKMGTTITRIKISPAGAVTEAKTVSANAVFKTYVLDALKQWRFQPSEKEHVLEVTCSFEFIQNECEGTNVHRITSETYVAAELPTFVHIKTGLQCLETNSSQRRR